jgi:hypothetical protein
LVQETVGVYHADVYAVDGLVLVSKKRREHLNDADIKRNKDLLHTFQQGKLIAEDLEVRWRGRPMHGLHRTGTMR